MVRENQKYLNTLQVFLDIFVIYFSFICTFYIRFYVIKDGGSSFTLQESLFIITLLLPVYLFLYNWFDLYSSRRIKAFASEVWCIIGTNILAILILVSALYLLKEMNFARSVLGLFPTLCSLFTILYRGFIRYILRRYRKQGYNLKHCLVIGTAPISSELIYKIRNHKAWGYNIIGCVRTDDRKTGAFCGYRILGNLEDLEEIFNSFHIDIAMIATDEKEAANLGAILRVCEKVGVKVNIIPYYYKYVPARPYIDDLDGLPIIDTRHIPLDNLFKAFLKRTFDIIFSLLVIILFSPLFIFSAIMVKLSSPGPILFKQERVGRNRKSFYMYKFRSMRVQTEEDEKGQWTTENDPRKTKWGTFMRKTSIDEFPQFFNVLKGDMSVIGPRPERPFFVDKFKEEIPRYMIKHQVRPGITGWAQVNGFRGDTSIEGRIEYDLYYIENWTFSLDMKIVFLTIFKGFINKNAY